MATPATIVVVPRERFALARRSLESIYDKMESSLSSARLEFLEWIVIILIGLELVLPFVTGRR